MFYYLLQLLLDIYLVRESGEFDLEEDLFAKLLFLYRSPETLIKWTRPYKGKRKQGNSQPMIAQYCSLTEPEMVTDHTHITKQSNLSEDK
jgi:hypothetical protein